MPRRRRRKAESLKIVNPDCAGIDIGKDTHYVAVDPERYEEPVRSIDAFTSDLEEMAAWLLSRGWRRWRWSRPLCPGSWSTRCWTRPASR